MKITVFATLVLFICLVAGISIWRTAYHWQSSPPKRVTIETLDDPVQILWGEFNSVEIRAKSMPDALTGLGYVQGRLNGWTIALWRQAALGRLSDWYTPMGEHADRLVLQLGLAEIAQAAASNLDAREKELITAFGAGIQSAWKDTDYMHEFFLQEITPEPWEPWHTLAIERLLAWISTSPDSVCGLGLSVCSGDAELRSMLHLQGFEFGSSWILSSPERSLLYQRHVLGNAVPLVFQEAVLNVQGQSVLEGLSLIGTPFFPTGKSRNYAWSILVYSPKATGRVFDSLDQQMHLTFPLREEIVIHRRTDSTFSTPEALHELKWSGFSAVSDAKSWFSLPRVPSAEFQLWQGAGILMSPDGSWNVLGEPKFVFPVDSGLVIGNNPQVRHAALYLDGIDPRRSDVDSWVTDTQSNWVRDTLSTMLASLPIDSVEQALPDAPAPINSALTYLINWDYRFDSQSIGATIYHEWAMSTGRDLEESLYDAISRLTRKFGDDQTQWLWERVYESSRMFTIHRRTDSRIFEPLEVPFSGHETTMAWGGAHAAVAPVTWEAWIWNGTDAHYTIRRHRVDIHQPLGRYTTSNNQFTFSFPTPYSMTTSLVP
ncbi:MAG: penicillin acylase family protein [Rhodothermaceae bacterium]|nr:penicillin acylase family protein [Rhodothermaceae bacterium]MXX58476.1 penicillin acylase family protein [Rhodothermaceae bacterium]MYD19205.1 penicillin acylase family protein [Rhodothermaceae bacterium]MYD55460.1 penicillin acylase family protein [Rhodothermaceae bacterium]MYI43520.1 penicillin acylase family protein [Rhodothermaceae bacterium]